MMILPNLLLGFYFPMVQKAIQSDGKAISCTIEFDKQQLLIKLDLPPVIDFIEDKVGIDVKSAAVETYSQAESDLTAKVNTGLFPRGEYYLNVG